MMNGKKKKTKRGFVIIVMLFLFGAALIGQLPGRNYLKAKRVSYAAVRLPAGSSKEQVTEFLQRSGLEYSYYEGKDEIDIDSMVREQGYSSANLGGYTAANIHSTSWGFIFFGSVHYRFLFDRKGKLIKVVAEERMTGL